MAIRRTQSKNGKKPTKAPPTTPVPQDAAVIRRAAQKSAAALEKCIGKEMLESLLLDGLKGKGEEATPEWWKRLDAEVAEEIRQAKRRS